jgi:hypothetical protein
VLCVAACVFDAGADGRPAKLQTEVRRLQRDLQNQQRHRLELSEEVLQDARAQLQTLHATVRRPLPDADFLR